MCVKRHAWCNTYIVSLFLSFFPQPLLLPPHVPLSSAVNDYCQYRLRVQSDPTVGLYDCTLVLNMTQFKLVGLYVQKSLRQGLKLDLGGVSLRSATSRTKGLLFAKSTNCSQITLRSWLCFTKASTGCGL